MNERVMLYSEASSPEHLFHLSLKARDDGYVVHTAHGPRSTRLVTEAITPAPVHYDHAKCLYTDLLTNKMAQGYHVEAHFYPEERRHPIGNLRPVRPLDLEMTQAGRFLSDPDWWLQEKYRGQHLLLRKTREAIEGLDADGLVVPLPAAVTAAAEKLHFRWVLEGVCVGDTFMVVDMAQFELLDFRSVSYSVRMAAIQELLPRPDPHLQIAETAVGITAKVEMLQRLRIAEKDGIVLRKVNGISRRGNTAVDGYVWQCAFPQSRPASTEAVSPTQLGHVPVTQANILHDQPS